jgi:hypothetical protein
LEAVAAFQFRGFNSGTNSFVYPDLSNIIAPIFTSFEGFLLSGTMSWTTTTLGGNWSMMSPVFEAPEHSPPLLGATYYRLSDVVMESFWPLEYFPNESSVVGHWHPVPEAGGITLLFSLTVCALLAFKHRRWQTVW